MTRLEREIFAAIIQINGIGSAKAEQASRVAARIAKEHYEGKKGLLEELINKQKTIQP